MPDVYSHLTRIDPACSRCRPRTGFHAPTDLALEIVAPYPLKNVLHDSSASGAREFPGCTKEAIQLLISEDDPVAKTRRPRCGPPLKPVATWVHEGEHTMRRASKKYAVGHVAQKEDS